MSDTISNWTFDGLWALDNDLPPCPGQYPSRFRLHLTVFLTVFHLSIFLLH
jgi:hypothetical protein